MAFPSCFRGGLASTEGGCFSSCKRSVAIVSVLSAYVPVPAMAQQASRLAPLLRRPRVFRRRPSPITPSRCSCGRATGTSPGPHKVFPNFLKTWEPITVAAPVTTNSQRLDALVHNGKIYLSLADAIVLGLENNYDIAIQRYNLDIADTELLRARAGSNLLGVSSRPGAGYA